jgi:hypothetical protein
VSEGESIRVPPWVLWSALALILFTIGLSVGARQLDRGLFQPELSEAVESRRIVFRAGKNGSVDAYGLGGQHLANYVIEGNRFAIVAIQALSKNADGSLTGDGVVLEVVRTAEGEVALADPETGETLPLEGFGPDNIATLSVLIDR